MADQVDEEMRSDTEEWKEASQSGPAQGEVAENDTTTTDRPKEGRDQARGHGNSLAFAQHFVQPFTRMYELVNAPVKEDARQERLKLLEAAIIGCNTLNELVTDPEFAKFAEKYSLDLTPYMGNLQEIIADPIAFGKFVSMEYKILVDAKIPTQYATDVCDECMRAATAALEGKADLPKLGDAVIKLQDEACAVAGRLAREQKAEADAAKARQALQSILVGVGGVFMTVCSTIAHQSGLLSEPWFNVGGALSSALVGYCCGQAIQRISDMDKVMEVTQGSSVQLRFLGEPSSWFRRNPFQGGLYTPSGTFQRPPGTLNRSMEDLRREAQDGPGDEHKKGTPENKL